MVKKIEKSWREDKRRDIEIRSNSNNDQKNGNEAKITDERGIAHLRTIFFFIMEFYNGA